MEQETIFQILRAIAPGIAGAVGSMLVMGWLYKGMGNETSIKAADAEIFTYAPRTRKFMTGLGLTCLLFAIGPLLMIGLKYYGPDPMAPTHSCYRPFEDWSAGIALFLGFGLGSITCLIDPWKYFAKADSNGITVRGIFTGTRFCRWSDINEIVDHGSCQMISIRGKNENGKSQWLWVPYIVAGFPILLGKLNEHGLFFKYQTEAIKDIKAYLTEQGHPTAIPYKLYLPFLTLWRLQGEPTQYIAVLFGVTIDEKTHLEHHITTGSPADLLQEVIAKLKNKGFGYHPEFQQDIAIDMAEIIETLN